jgi:hypothetical protein
VREGVLEKFGVELIGAKREAIDMAEDRELFRNAMAKIGLESPRSPIARTMDEALRRSASRLPGDHPPVVHDGRHRRRHRLQPRGVREIVTRGLMPRPSARC